MKKTAFICVLLLSLSCSRKKTADPADLKSRISAITAGKKATVAVSVHAFETDFKAALNGDEMLPLLSVFKFHIAIAVLELVDEKKLDLNQKILISKADLREDTYSPFRDLYPEGNVEIPLRDLIQYMVSKSDNNITDVLIKLVGGTQKVQAILNGKGAESLVIQADEAQMHQAWANLYLNKSSTNALNGLLQKFFEGKLLSKNATQFLMQTMLETTTGTTKIVAQLPEKTPVAHKTGSSGRNKDGLTAAENDIAIITLPDGRHYALSILVSDSRESEEMNTKMIADISKLTYDFLNTPQQ